MRLSRRQRSVGGSPFCMCAAPADARSGCCAAEGIASGGATGCEQRAAVPARHKHRVCAPIVCQCRVQRSLPPAHRRRRASARKCNTVPFAPGMVLQADVARAEDKNYLALSQVAPPCPHLPLYSCCVTRQALQALEKASLAPAIPALKAGALTSFSAKVHPKLQLTVFIFICRLLCEMRDAPPTFCSC
jgi:hypothetical protein